MFNLNYFNTSVFLGGLVTIFTGLFVISKNKKNHLYRRYFVFSLSVALWSIGYYLFISFPQKNIAIIGYWLQNSAIFIPATHLHFVFALLGVHKEKKKDIFICYITSFLLLFLTFTPFYIQDLVPKYKFYYYIEPRIGYYLFAISFTFWVIYAFYYLFKAIRKSVGLKATQLKFFRLASLIGFTGGASAFWLTFNIPCPPYFLILFALYPLVITYAILRHRLMDIQVAFSKSLVAILLGVCVIGFDILFVKLLHPVIGYYFSGAIAMLIIGGVLFATPLSRKLQLGMDQMVLGGKYNYQNILRETSRTVLTILDLNDMVNYIINMLKQSLEVEKITILLKDVEGYKLQYGYGVEEQMQNGYEIKGGIIEWLENKKEIFVKEEQQPTQMFSDMEKIGAELVVPLFHRGELEGILTLSAKGTGEPYVQSDIDLLEMLGANISTAIRNARLYNEAVTDSLTGLYRHEYFQLKLAEEIEKSKRNRSLLSLLVIDLDQFKEINERYGSEVRDIVLKRLAIILRKNVEKTDIVSRYGTDGFAMILFGANSNLVAERLRKEVAREEFVVGAGPRACPSNIRMTVSIGVACFDGVGAGSEPALTEKKMLIRANSAAAAVKNRGGNGVEVF